MVPTTVRVEAGWDRSDPRAAVANHLSVRDAPLDTASADRAADIARRTGVSVTDAHVGAVVGTLADGDIVVLTSDPNDMVRAASPMRVTAIRI